MSRRVELSDHARRQAARRGLSELVVLGVACAPEQVIEIRPGREVRQSRIVDLNGGTYLVRVVTDRTDHDMRVVTVYRTTKVRKYLEHSMKVEYDGATDSLTVVLRGGTVAESDETRPGVILDYDEAGNLLSIEVLDASQRVEEPRTVTFSSNG